MKKMLLASLPPGPAYYRMCSTDVYCFKQTGSSSTRNHHPSFLRFWNWAEENCRCSQNLWRRENVVKTKPNANISCNGLLPVLLAQAFILRWKRVCIAHNCMSCPSIWATLSTLLINILLGSFQLFLHSDQPLSEVK